MAWEQLSINKPHLVYIILGGFTSIFMLVSLFIKEKLYIGEATVATICGVIFGPHAANLINPLDWGNTDQITLEFSRIVLVVQCFAVGVELPKAYMERHWKSVVLLLVPVMTWGWLITSLFVWWMIEPLTWLESLAVAACVTATDPVLASSVVGKGKFAKRVPKHLRDLLSAESGCNDGMAFPFIYLPLYLLHYHLKAKDVAFHWICFTILYECIFGAVYGVCVGYIGRHAIKYAEKKGLIDRESFLVFYFVLALFCAGSGSMLGMDDLLIGFAAGVGFSNDGWFTEKTEESHVSNVIDLLINLSYFVYFGTIIPWDQFNAPNYGLEPWRLVVIAILVIFFRRIPIMLLLKPIIPDVKTWREALFAGHFGPIGVGAIFVAILARAELETGSTTPLDELPDPNSAEYVLIWTIWPIVTFLVISSIIVHGSSIAVFTLGKRINTLTITLTYTQDNDRSGAWINRLPRISSQGRSMSKMSDDEMSIEKDVPPGQLPPIGLPKLALRRQKDDEYERAGSRSSSLRPLGRRKKRKEYGGQVHESAINPASRSEPRLTKEESGSDTLNEKASPDEKAAEKDLEQIRSGESDPEIDRMQRRAERETGKRKLDSDSDNSPADVEAYEEGRHLIIEDAEGNVLRNVETRGRTAEEKATIIDEVRQQLTHDKSGQYAKHKHEPHKKTEGEEVEHQAAETIEHPEKSARWAFDKWAGFGKKKGAEGDKGREDQQPARKRGPAHAYQFGNTVIVEDADGEVIKTYTIPGGENQQRRFTYGNEQVRQGLQRMGTWVGLGGKPEKAAAEASGVPPEKLQTVEDNADEAVSPDERAKPLVRRDTYRKRGANDDDTINDDDGLRLTISRADHYGLTGLQKRKQGEGKDEDPINIGSGRRMSTKDFIKQMQQLDPKSKIKTVESSDASEDIKAEVRRDAQRQSGFDPSRPGARRMGTTPGRPGHVDSDDESERSSHRPAVGRRSQSDVPTPAVRIGRPRSSTTGSDRIVEEDRDVPIHDPRSAVARAGGGMTAAEQRRRQLSTQYEAPVSEEEDDDDEEQETAAERRRRLAALGRGDEESDSDEFEDDRSRRLPAAQNVQAHGGSSRVLEDPDEEQETAAERKRRLAALGRGVQESDSDESESEAPRRPRDTAVREPDVSPHATSRRSAVVPKPRIQWGGESGRETTAPEKSDADASRDVERGGVDKSGKGLSGKLKGFLKR